MNCPNCSTENEEGSTSCAMCFFVFKVEPPTESPTDKAETPAEGMTKSTAEPTPPKAFQDNDLECPSCQAMNSAKAKSCRKCYHRFSDEPEATKPDEATDAPSDEPRDCPNCATINPPQAPMCSMCNFVFPKVAATKKEKTARPPRKPPVKKAPALSGTQKSPKATGASKPSAPPRECPACGHANAASRNACELCEYTFPKGEEVATDPTKSAPVDPPKQEPRVTPMSPDAVPMGQPFEQRHTPAPPQLADGEGLECPQCQTVNPAGTLACSMCYHSFEAPPAAKPTHSDTLEEPAVPESAKPQGETCPVCNFLNAPGSPACNLCFTVFENYKAPPAEPLREDPPEPEPEPEPEPQETPVTQPDAASFDGEAPLASVKPEDLDSEAIPSPLGALTHPEEITEEAPKEDSTKKEKQPDVDPEQVGSAPGTTPDTPKKKRKRRRSFVLIVEDDPEHAVLINTWLESRGVNWRTDCVDAKQALIQAEALNVGLVLMDLMLPGFGTGADSYKALRKSSFLAAELPVIFMTGLPPEKTKLMLPADDPHVRVVHKPIDFDLLAKYIIELTDDLFIKPE
jgi:CheY-like chemotaxis protein